MLDECLEIVSEDIAGESRRPRKLVLSDRARDARLQSALDGIAGKVVRRRVATVGQEHLGIPEPFLSESPKVPSVHGTSAKAEVVCTFGALTIAAVRREVNSRAQAFWDDFSGRSAVVYQHAGVSTAAASQQFGPASVFPVRA